MIFLDNMNDKVGVEVHETIANAVALREQKEKILKDSNLPTK